ncbi:MAG TPA: (d)CMP kinase [Bacteroidota bacterium]|nr:(d)CMP kinase [Bacteroidota bacterium]
MLKKLVIAIDGPAASGKSTTAKITAERLSYLYIDTGAMYRAVTFKVLTQKINLGEVEKISQLAEGTEIRLQQIDNLTKVFLDRQDVTNAIRTPEVTAAVSAVSSIKKVRELMVREQRRMGKEGGVVLEGRDIGTVVFPDADLKIFMVADVGKRAQRRQRDLEEQSVFLSLDELRDQITSRDQKDSERDISPLRKAEDAVILDTSRLTIEQQVNFIVERAKALIEKK